MKKITTKVLASVGVGAITGGATYTTIGGMGLAVGGTAVGITLGPMILIGSGVALTVMGAVEVGKKLKK